VRQPLRKPCIYGACRDFRPFFFGKWNPLTFPLNGAKIAIFGGLSCNEMVTISAVLPPNWDGSASKLHCSLFLLAFFSGRLAFGSRGGGKIGGGKKRPRNDITK